MHHSPTTGPERLFCAWLRGDPPGESIGDSSSDVSRLVAAARYHGVLPLLHERLSGRGAGSGLPAAFMESCQRDAASHRIMEFARRAELPRVLEAFAAAAIKPLLLKGSAIAETHYPDAALRPTSDVDLLVPEAQKLRAQELVRRLGYAKSDGVTGDLICHQATWTRKDELEIPHALDIHWRISNSHILAKLLDFDELEPRSVRLPRLGANAYGLAAPHALLFACMHRAGHRNAPYYVDGVAYPGAERLIWVYDVHLLFSRMSSREIEEFLALAAAKRLKAVCLEALDRSAECFGTRIPADVLDDLRRTGRDEPAARYLAGGRMLQTVGDLFAIESWTQRALFLKELSFPPSAYMRDRYAEAGIRFLPVLYARRAMDALWRAATARDPHARP